MHVNDSVATIPKIRPSTLKQLKALGIETVADLLQYYPRRYLDFTKFTHIKDIVAGETVTLQVTIKSIQAKLSWSSKRMVATAVVSDETGSLKVTWFNQGYMAKTLQPGDQVFLAGKVEQYKGLQLINPIQERVTDHNLHTGRLVPVYKLPDTLYSRTFRTLVDAALPAAHQLTDILPHAIRTANHLPTTAQTVQELHFPTNAEAVAHAQERLAFEESFIQQLAVQQHKLELKALAAPGIPTDIEFIKSLIAELPFALTDGQKKALWTILQDLEHKHPMNRLLQGDVGSGKTVVALLAALQAIQNGYQVALLVPTEILAKQHFDGIIKQHKMYGLAPTSISLFTRNFHQIGSKDAAKTTSIKMLQTGKTSLVVGTHALLQESVLFKNLALVIIDEQHRFGVEQRRTLGNPTRGQRYPHLLSMSATPIPRTAAMAVYGDLEISTIDELPKNRLPIKTWVIPEEKRLGAYDFVKKEIRAGRQAFIITPLVEESEKLRVKAAKIEFERLQKEIFTSLKMGLVYGSMKGAEKDAAMLAFKNKETDILVATSVIEIGIDIPNATVMIIEGADRFGLAQLHQLRGRVGRGEHQSYCFLFSDNETSKERLEFFATTRDGFKLAEYDMKTRGFGSLFGTDQTGFAFKYGQYLTLKVLESAKSAAHELVKENPDLSQYPDLAKLSEPLSKELHLE